MIYRIGDRDPVTGLYDVIHADGSFTRNGLKIFNSAHQFGDVVLATQRSDGMLILDGVKATVTEIVTTNFGLGGFGEKPVGYLNGQVFNNEEEVILPTVSIEFAPGSLQELAPQVDLLDQIPYSQRVFVVRIKIDRPQRKDLQVKLELSGTASSSNYTVATLPSRTLLQQPGGVTILQGKLYVDVEIFHSQPNRSGVNQTIVLTAISQREYRVSTPSITATILYLPILSMSVSESFSPEGRKVFTFRVQADIGPLQSVRCVISLSGTFLSYTTSDNLSSGNIIINIGQSSTTFSVTAFSTASDIGKFLDVLLARDLINYRREFPVTYRIAVI